MLLGTAIEGTLRNQDLIPELGSILKDLSDEPKELFQEIEEISKYPEEDEIWDRDEYAYELLNEIIDYLNLQAPPFCYFGVHPGNGSDFGFWPDRDQIEDAIIDDEIVVVSDLSQVKKHGFVLEVNDHGNETLYYYVNGVFHEIWSIV